MMIGATPLNLLSDACSAAHAVGLTMQNCSALSKVYQNEMKGGSEWYGGRGACYDQWKLWHCPPFLFFSILFSAFFLSPALSHAAAYCAPDLPFFATVAWHLKQISAVVFIGFAVIVSAVFGSMAYETIKRLFR